MFEDKSQELTPISKLGEFGLIKHLTEHFPLQNESSELGVGDDAAVINPDNKNAGKNPTISAACAATN